MVAAFAGEIVEAFAFASKYEDAVAGEVEVVVVLGAALVESDDPKIAALELFECADEIDDAGEANVLGCSGAGLYGDRAERGGTAFSEYDAINACAIGDAEKRAEVLGVFNAVESENEAGFGLAVVTEDGLVEVFEGEELLRADEGYDALMAFGAGEMRELLAGLGADADAALTAQENELVNALGGLAGDDDLVKASTACLERLLNRMNSVQNFHTFSVVALLRSQLGTDQTIHADAFFSSLYG